MPTSSDRRPIALAGAPLPDVARPQYGPATGEYVWYLRLVGLLGAWCRIVAPAVSMHCRAQLRRYCSRRNRGRALQLRPPRDGRGGRGARPADLGEDPDAKDRRRIGSLAIGWV